MTVRLSNEVFFDVIEEATQQSTGWSFHVRPPDNLSQLLYIVPRWNTVEMQKVLSDTGAGSLVVSMDDTAVYESVDFQTYVKNDENVIQCVKDGVVRFAFLPEEPVEKHLSTDEKREYTATGRGIAAILEWATVLPPSYPTFTALDHTWADTPGMAAWKDLKDEADVRGAASSVIALSFTESNDGAGVPWADSNNLTLKPGGDLLKHLQKSAEMSTADWQVNPATMILDARQAYGIDRSNRVRFFVGSSQLTNEIVRARRSISNVVYTISANEQVPFVQDPISMAQWGRRELLAEVANAQDSTTAQRFGQLILDQVNDEVLSFSFKVLPEAEGASVFADYDVGDYVYIDSLVIGLSGKYQVMAITLKIDADGNEDLELTLNSMLQLRLIQLQRQFERETGATLRTTSELQVGNTGGGGGSSGLSKFSKADVDLGIHAPGPIYTWFTITGVPKRGMQWRFELNSGGSINWAVQVRSKNNGEGELMFEAVGIGDVDYSCSWPWVYENQDDPPTAQMYIGIRNISGATSQFTLVDMRGEQFSF